MSGSLFLERVAKSETGLGPGTDIPFAAEMNEQKLVWGAMDTDSILSTDR